MSKKNKRSARRTVGQTPHATAQADGAQPAKPAKQYTPKSATPKPQPKPKRTIVFIIAVAYVILHGLIWSAALFATNRAAVDRAPIIYYLLLGASLIDVIAGVGMWFWQKWAPGLFLAASLLTAGFVTLLTASLWVGMGALIPAIVVAYITLPKVTQAAAAA